MQYVSPPIIGHNYAYMTWIVILKLCLIQNKRRNETVWCVQSRVRWELYTSRAKQSAAAAATESCNLKPVWQLGHSKWAVRRGSVMDHGRLYNSIAVAAAVGLLRSSRLTGCRQTSMDGSTSGAAIRLSQCSVCSASQTYILMNIWLSMTRFAFID